MPTDDNAAHNDDASHKESEQAIATTKRRETSDCYSSEEYDQEYEDYKVKAEAFWKYFRRNATKWIEAGCAVLLVIITGRYTVFAKHQWKEMMRTNELTKQSMHSTGRAWVGVESFTPVSFDRDDQGAMLTVTLTLQNYGHSAAEHIQVFPELVILSSSAATTGACDDSKSGIYVGFDPSPIN